MLSKSSCLSESLVLCTSEVRPNYFPIFYNISPAAMRAFLFPSFSIALVQLLLSFCKESANLGKEIHSQLWQGGKSHISRDHRPWVSDENILRWWWWWYHNQWHYDEARWWWYHNGMMTCGRSLLKPLRVPWYGALVGKYIGKAKIKGDNIKISYKSCQKYNLMSCKCTLTLHYIYDFSVGCA